ncbi:hypothetical protein R3P38DRAFT_3425946 [Favolaschia claudopus]|uniref:Uncharacterized protein n=1 Tax=Favolaschia claudopus TaxID=2862362 RepID=A0AAV9ZVY2_9AGAR
MGSRKPRPVAPGDRTTTQALGSGGTGAGPWLVLCLTMNVDYNPRLGNLTRRKRRVRRRKVTDGNDVGERGIAEEGRELIQPSSRHTVSLNASRPVFLKLVVFESRPAHPSGILSSSSETARRRSALENGPCERQLGILLRALVLAALRKNDDTTASATRLVLENGLVNGGEKQWREKAEEGGRLEHEVVGRRWREDGQEIMSSIESLCPPRYEPRYSPPSANAAETDTPGKRLHAGLPALKAEVYPAHMIAWGTDRRLIHTSDAETSNVLVEAAIPLNARSGGS